MGVVAWQQMPVGLAPWTPGCKCAAPSMQPTRSKSPPADKKRQKKEEEICSILSSKGSGVAAGDMDVLTRYDNSITTKLVARVLKRVPDVELAFEFFQWAGRRRGFKHTTAIYNLMLEMLCKENKDELCLTLLDYMQMRQVAMDKVTFATIGRIVDGAATFEAGIEGFKNLTASGFRFNGFANECLMGAILEEKRFEIGFETLKQMLKAGETVHPGAANALVKELCKVGKIDTISELLPELKARDVKLSKIVHTECIQAFGKSGDLESVLEIFNDLRQDGFRETSTVTFTAVMHWLCEARKMDEAVKLLDEMKDYGFPPSEVTYNALIAGFCKAGDAEKAMEVFSWLKDDEVCNPDPITFDTLLTYLSKMNNTNDALSVFKDGLQRSCKPDVEACNNLLRSLHREARLADAGYVHKGMLELGCKPNTYSYALLICAYCKSGCMEEALELMKLAHEDDCPLTTTTYNYVIEGLIKVSRLPEAYQIFQADMKKDSAAPTAYTFRLLIEAHGRAGNLDAVWQLFSEMQTAGLRVPRSAFNSVFQWLRMEGKMDDYHKFLAAMNKQGMRANVDMLITLANAGRINDALDTLKSALQNGFDPPIPLFKTLIDIFAKAGKFDEACEVFLEMRDVNVRACDFLMSTLATAGQSQKIETVLHRSSNLGLVPDEVIYSSLLKTLCKSANLAEANKYYQEMHHMDLVFSTPGLLVTVLCKSGQIKAALTVLEQAEEAAVKPNSVTYNIVLDALAEMGDGYRLYEMFGRTKKAGCADVITYNTMISYLAKQEQIDKIISLVEHQMPRRGVQPNSQTYNILIDVLSRTGRLDEAIDCFNMMSKSQEHPPDIVTYNTLLNGLKKHSRFDDASKLYEQLISENRCKPNHTTLGTIIDVFVKSDRLEDALKVHDEIAKKGRFPPTSYIHNSLILGFLKAGRTSEAVQALRTMRKEGCRPDNLSYSRLVVGLARAGDINTASDLLEEMIEKGHEPTDAVIHVLVGCLTTRGHLEQAQNLLRRLMGRGFKPALMVDKLDGISQHTETEEELAHSSTL